MSYAEFLCWFVLPVALAGAVVVIRSGRTAWGAVGALLVVALVYTTPWDSWLISNDVWGYPANGVLGWVFRVPFEEYLFLLGMCVTTAGWTLWLLSRRRHLKVTGERPAVAAMGWAGAALVAIEGRTTTAPSMVSDPTTDR